MRLAHLALERLPQLRAAELHPDPGLTIVAGPNGAGKTNLLEAICVAITGRSPRAAVGPELVGMAAPYARSGSTCRPCRRRRLAPWRSVLPGAAPPAGSASG